MVGMGKLPDGGEIINLLTRERTLCRRTFETFTHPILFIRIIILKMDIVYVLQEWYYDCMELRISLRSLKNIPHGKVFIVWYKPDRVKNVIHIPCEDNDWRTPYANVEKKQIVICNDERISADFIFMNDDYYILKPISEIKYYKRWTVLDHAKNVLERHWFDYYYRTILLIDKVFPWWDSYEVHTPIVFNKEKLLHIMDIYKDSIAQKRSLYCNHYKVQWETLGEKLDCKLYDGEKLQVEEDQIFLSNDIYTAEKDSFRNFLYQLFPTPSEYE